VLVLVKKVEPKKRSECLLQKGREKEKQGVSGILELTNGLGYNKQPCRKKRRGGERKRTWEELRKEAKFKGGGVVTNGGRELKRGCRTRHG